ncbi:hypothetical protein SCHPADRAFT_939004 [Schizopora paradoxa]|uniref:Uncharacterized protein n=1 Tax=Schizopora paradoxa TaxID=27342 RepID=A0A0H2SDQ2_9AGAM|nr:hypothetical protein SCHPADRAFT_939004 [Schizopora paradoxa]
MSTPENALQSGQIYAIQLLHHDSSDRDSYFLGVETSALGPDGADVPVVLEHVSSPIAEANRFHWRITDSSEFTQEPKTCTIQFANTAAQGGPGGNMYLKKTGTPTPLSLALGPYPISWILRPSPQHKGYFRIKALFPPIRYGFGPFRANLFVTAGGEGGRNSHVELRTSIPNSAEGDQLWKLVPIPI